MAVPKAWTGVMVMRYAPAVLKSIGSSVATELTIGLAKAGFSSGRTSKQKASTRAEMYLQAADEVSKLIDILGISISDANALRHASSMANVDAYELASDLDTARRVLSDPAMYEYLKDLGLDVGDFKSIDTVQEFMLSIRDTLGGLDNTVQSELLEALGFSHETGAILLDGNKQLADNLKKGAEQQAVTYEHLKIANETRLKVLEEQANLEAKMFAYMGKSFENVNSGIEELSSAIFEGSDLFKFLYKSVQDLDKDLQPKQSNYPNSVRMIWGPKRGGAGEEPGKNSTNNVSANRGRFFSLMGGYVDINNTKKEPGENSTNNMPSTSGASGEWYSIFDVLRQYNNAPGASVPGYLLSDSSSSVNQTNHITVCVEEPNATPEKIADSVIGCLQETYMQAALCLDNNQRG